MGLVDSLGHSVSKLTAQYKLNNVIRYCQVDVTKLLMLLSPSKPNAYCQKTINQMLIVFVVYVCGMCQL